MHEGHRARVRQRVMNEGLEHFQAHEILELVLFFAIPYRDTNELAHRLLARFGSLSGVFEADMAELTAIEGVGENAATLLRLIPELTRIYNKDKWSARPQLNSRERAGEYALSLFIGRTDEAFYLLCLDNHHHLNHAALIAEGTINESAVYPRKVVEAALRHKATNVILAHNHPSGSVTPSLADIEMTRRIAEALLPIGVTVADHIIAAGDSYLSFANKGLLRGENIFKADKGIDKAAERE